jgi:putative ABC transport system substrate-binding protein
MRFEIMLELLPQAKRMLIPYQRGYPIVSSELEALRLPGAEAGVTFVEVPVDDAAELEAELKALESLSSGIGIEAVLLIPEPLFSNPEVFIVMAKFAVKHKIPIGGTLIMVGEYGSVFGLRPQNVAVGKQAAFLANKVLEGNPAGTIPVISAEAFLQINYKAAQKLGLEVSEGLLSRASEIIR